MSTVIDDEDWDLVRGYRWKAHNSSGRFYAIAQWEELGEKKHILMHRLLLGLNDPKVLVDHKDGDGLNNKRSNLRPCTHAENMRNSKVRAHNKTGVRNVRYEVKPGCKTGLFIVRVQHEGKRHQKYFKTLDDAAVYAKRKAAEMHGEFAYAGPSDVA
jgi:hypothetical protein